MNAFGAACKVEEQSRKILLPYIASQSDRNHYVLIDKSPLSRLLQEQVGDVFTNMNGSLVSVELKAERKHTGNLFCETWSNKNLKNRDSHSARGSNPGWMVKSQADYLFYHFLDNDALYIIPMFDLQAWAWSGAQKGKAKKFFDYREVEQGKYDQMNDTWGRLVPVEHLKSAIPDMRRVFPRQLSTYDADVKQAIAA